MSVNEPKVVAEWSGYRTIARHGPENLPGRYLLMSDGSEWFHPYTGAAPVRTRAPRAPYVKVER